jgi:hypothetical protein
MTDPWLQLCVGRPCVACGKDDGTIVPAHRNEGKGMGIKTDSAYSLPLCMSCHTLYDNGPMSRDEKRSFWRDCWVMHMSGLLAAGLVAPVGKERRERRPQRLAKILPRTA